MSFSKDISLSRALIHMMAAYLCEGTVDELKECGETHLEEAKTVLFGKVKNNLAILYVNCFQNI